MNVHEKEQMTVTIAGRKKVTFTNHKNAEITVNRLNDIGQVVDQITFKGEIVGRDQFGKELRLKSHKGATMSFRLNLVADIKQEDD